MASYVASLATKQPQLTIPSATKQPQLTIPSATKQTPALMAMMLTTA